MPDIFATKNMSKMIIETIERLSIDVFVTAMAITAVVIAKDIAYFLIHWKQEFYKNKLLDR